MSNDTTPANLGTPVTGTDELAHERRAYATRVVDDGFRASLTAEEPYDLRVAMIDTVERLIESRQQRESAARGRGTVCERDRIYRLLNEEIAHAQATITVLTSLRARLAAEGAGK